MVGYRDGNNDKAEGASVHQLALETHLARELLELGDVEVAGAVGVDLVEELAAERRLLAPPSDEVR